MSELPPPPQPHFSLDPLLTGQGRTAHFLRTAWDEASASRFGPWRVAQASDPVLGQTASAFVHESPSLSKPAPEPETALALPDPVPHDEATLPLADASTRPGGSPGATWSDVAMAALQDEAFERGVQQGLQQALAQHQEARQKEGELLRHLAIELRSLQQDPQRFFEPLKRLALHIAQQWVRGELQVSGHVIDQLVRQALAQLDPAGQKVLVELNPADLQRLQALGEAATSDLTLQADPLLREGSVRVRASESVVQDLIEHRVEALARQLLQQADAWLQRSPLLHPELALPVPDGERDSERQRRWSQRVQDVQDAQARAAPQTPQSEPEAP